MTQVTQLLKEMQVLLEMMVHDGNPSTALGVTFPGGPGGAGGFANAGNPGNGGAGGNAGNSRK